MQLMARACGTLRGGMGLIVVRCSVMRTGLPTVAVYVFGAILLSPALLKLGIPEIPESRRCRPIFS